MDGPVLEAIAPAQKQGDPVRAAKAQDPVEGAPLAQVKVDPEHSKEESTAAEGRAQIDFASWREQYLNKDVEVSSGATFTELTVMCLLRFDESLLYASVL